MKYLLLLLLQEIIRSQKCDKKILESYGIVSLLSPSKEKIIFCPNIKATCCPSYEQFKLQRIYNKHIKPHFIQRTDLIKKELQMLKEIIVPLLVPDGEIDQKVKNIQSLALKRQAVDLLAQLKVHKFDFLVDKAFEYQQKALDYINKLKTTFMCTICDFDAHEFLQFDQHIAIFNEESCDELVIHTIMYTNILNRGIVTFLQNLSNLLSKIDIQNKAISVPGVGMVIQSIKECSAEFKQTEKDLTSCKNYCNNFKLNSDLSVFEGYPEFFFNILVQLKKNFTPKKSNRILQALQDIDDQDDQKLVYQNNKLKYERKKQRYQKMLITLKNLYGERILEENKQFIDDLNPTLHQDEELLQDPFDEELSITQFDDLMMSQMLKIQKQIYDGEPQDLRKIIKTYIAESYNPEIEDIENQDIFKVATIEKANLEQLNTKFAAGGINLKQMIHTQNWTLQFHDIVLSLGGLHHSVGNEQVDQNLLAFINKARNIDVNNFHSDNFLKFKETNEFARQDYKKSRLDSNNLKIIKERQKYQKAHQLLRDYGLENVDTIITEIQQKRQENGPIYDLIDQDALQQRLDKAQMKMHLLIQKEEEKNQQDKEFKENQQFLKQILQNKGIRGVIQDLRGQNQEISKLHLPEEQPQDQPNEQPQDQPNEQTQDQATVQPQNQPNEQLQDQANQQPQDQVNQQPQDQANEQPQNQPNEQQNTQQTDQPTN